MKKYNKFGYAGALLLAGLVSFSACSSDDELADVNPNYNPETETVKTQFAISVPYAGKSGRMTSAIVQNNGYTDFRGMSNLRLLPFDAPIERSASTHNIKGTIIDLEDLPKTSSNDTHLPDTQTKLYKDVDVPRLTSNMLFYAEATTTSSPLVNASDKFTYGQLNTNLGGFDVNSAETIKFNLVKCHDDATEYGNAKTSILTALNAIVQVDGWKALASTTPVEAGNQTLKKLYEGFVSLKAGSASMILAAVQDLYTSVSALTGDSDAGTLATAIQKAILGNFNVALETGTLSWKTDELSDFPAKFNLPDGAVSLNFTAVESPAFSYDENVSVVTNPNIKPADLNFPASLYYFVNSDLAVNAGPTIKFPDNITNWESEKWNSNGWSTAAVSPNTRGIALKKAINYGVARMDMSVKCKTRALDDATLPKAQKIAVDNEGFPVTAVLIGGQPDVVGWDMISSQDKFTQVVYDRIADGQVKAKYDVAAATGGVNHTLLLDNTKLTAVTSPTRSSTQADVYIAVELVNNTKVAFQGYQGLVPAGCKFYLIAKLQPSSGSFTDTTITSNPAVFMQDHTTTVNFTIRDLKNAYNVIPDLRTSEMQFGMAVDLKWQKGMEFNVEFD